jgi:glucosamine-6-phosphate deaminase
MEVVILHDAKEIGVVAADAIGALLDRQPAAVLGLATGSSPMAIYDELAARRDAGLISFRPRRVRRPARRPSAAVPERH